VTGAALCSGDAKLLSRFGAQSDTRLSMAQRLLRLASLVLAVCWLIPRSSLAQSDDPAFAAASAAFAGGDYAGALELFELVRITGGNEPAVLFNIGVCEYKLGRYADSAAAFESLGSRFPAMRPLAEYNRGLALLGLRRDADARAAFAAARASGDTKIAPLAAARLRDLEQAAPAVQVPRHWDGFLQVGVGHDDNVAFVDEVTLPVGQQADSPLAELYGLGSRRFGMTTPVRLDFGGYVVRYADAPQFEEDSVNVAAAFELARGAWSMDLGPHYVRSTLGGNPFEGEAGVTVRAARPFGDWRFSVLATYDDIDSLESQYDYLAGAQRRVRFTLAQRVGRGRFSASVEAEDNNLAAAAVSSERRRVLLGYRYGLGASWSVEGAVAYRLSRYERSSGPDERLTELFASVRRVLAHDWVVTADYRHTRNDADLADFAYTADRIALGVNRAF
jgi:tetratricopeptide (TPR) repeat protein